jgi:hypothetical protein
MYPNSVVKRGDQHSDIQPEQRGQLSGMTM